MRCALLLFLLFLQLACEAKRPEQRPTSTQPPATAAPHGRRPPSLPSARFTLAFAESTNTPAAWTAVADAFAQELTACSADCREIAYQVVLARKAAVTAAHFEAPPLDDVAHPVPDEIEAMIATIDVFVESLDAADDEAAPLKFLAAASLFRYGQPTALTRLDEFLREHRDDATAEYAANQLLDGLVRAGKIAELRAWAAELAADETFLVNKPVLRETLARVLAVLTPVD